MYCVSNRKWMQLESTLDLRFGRHFRADVWSIKFFQGVAAGADLVKTPVLSVATKFGKYAPGALVIPSSETVISLAVKHQIRTPHAVKIAIAEPEEGAAESWVKTFQWLWLPKTQVCAQPVVNTCMIFVYTFFTFFFYFTNNLSYNNYLLYEYLINKNLTAATALTPPPARARRVTRPSCPNGITTRLSTGIVRSTCSSRFQPVTSTPRRPSLP
jgi:hypothetical protein